MGEGGSFISEYFSEVYSTHPFYPILILEAQSSVTGCAQADLPSTLWSGRAWYCSREASMLQRGHFIVCLGFIFSDTVNCKECVSSTVLKVYGSLCRIGNTMFYLFIVNPPCFIIMNTLAYSFTPSLCNHFISKLTFDMSDFNFVW